MKFHHTLLLRLVMLYDKECWATMKQSMSEMNVVKMRMLRLMHDETFFEIKLENENLCYGRGSAERGFIKVVWTCLSYIVRYGS